MRLSRHRRKYAIVIGILAVMLDATVSVQGQQLAPIDPHQVIVPIDQSLRLEVFINGVSTQLVEPFTLTPDNHLLATRSDLEDIGIRVPEGWSMDAAIDVASLQGVASHYDEQRQTIDFTLKDSDRLPRSYDARSAFAQAPPASANWGAVLNYSVFGATMNQIGQFPKFQGFNASFDGRAFSPYGAITQTAILGNTVASHAPYLRLDSTYEYSDQDRMLTARAGDIISGGLVWSRPVRLGGFQIQRNFGLRSDLITQPLPMISGSAAVPSTVDVFVNNVKAYSQDVSTGPYNISNLPVISGNGSANIVVTDSTGRQTTTTVPFFTTPTLLAAGLSDFSIDAGFARLNYGTLSNDYDRRPVGLGTARYGVTDWLTAETHAEGGAGLMNGGLGASSRIGAYGTLSLAAAASHNGSQVGAQFYGDYNFQLGGFNLDVSSQRTAGSYNDLASVTATATPLTSFEFGRFDPRPPAALDRITIGAPLPFQSASVSASFVNLVQADGTHSRIVTASLSRPLPHNAQFFATGFADLSHHQGIGVYAGFSIPLGEKIQASLGGSLDGSSRQSTLDVGQPLDHTDGSFSWRLRDSEGGDALRIGDAAYRSAYGTASVEVSQQGKSFNGQGAIDGSVGYVSGGGPFVANHVQDGFAVVNTGIAGVPVYEDNRLIGQTNPWGQYVLPDIQSYQANQIGIDPLALPMNAEATTTKQTISTAGHSGVALNFGIDRHIDAALVTFRDAGGAVIAAGSKGHTQTDDETFFVGYDGQGYVKHLKADNTVVIDLGDRDCVAKFSFQSQAGERPVIGPVTCQ